ncbi:hypothetical protein [Allonocardiopsis opalescens]|uniref:hypothetical protein n=1 Tax=Allonocardiopsis opalescens TaxID=1144618 RepID=UPI0011B229A4|nr:hypothetical protein [Allonocardiopsis opalescens]
MSPTKRHIPAAESMVELGEALHAQGLDYRVNPEDWTVTVWRGNESERVALRPNDADGGRHYWHVWWKPGPDPVPGSDPVGDLDPIVPVEETAEMARRMAEVLYYPPEPEAAKAPDEAS